MAAAAMASSISTSINTRMCPCSDLFLKISCTRSLQVGGIAHAHTIESLGAISHKWRVPRILAAVAQEEAAASAAVENEEAIEAEEVSGDGEAESHIVNNTKLYFGNLPYNVDSAQLAGIIQEYASPELIEVCT